MNLTERSTNLYAQLKKLEQTKVLASQAVHFGKRAEELAAASNELVPVAKTFRSLKGLVAFNSVSELSISDWNFRLASLREKYALDPESILTPTPGEDARAVFLNPLKQLPSRIKTAMTADWSAWANKQIPTINDDLIGVLAGISSMKGKVDKLRALRRVALDATTRLPNAQAEVARFLADVEDLRQAWDALAGDEIPKEVVDFLRIAGRPEGADFDRLTPSLLKWFRERHLDQMLRIRVT